MSLRCLLGHATRLVVTQTEGRIVCTRCQTVLDAWPILRPEDWHREQRRELALRRDRELRASRMSGTTPSLSRLRVIGRRAER